MPNNLALLYKETKRLCQLRFPQATAPSVSGNFWVAAAYQKYRRSLPLPIPEIKSFSRLRGDFNMFFQSHAVAKLHNCRGGVNVSIQSAVARPLMTSRVTQFTPPEVMSLLTKRYSRRAMRKSHACECRTRLGQLPACTRQFGCLLSGHRHTGRGR